MCSVISNSFQSPWTVASQVPLSIGFYRQEYRSELPFPPPGDLLDPRIKPASPASPAFADRFFATEPPGNPIFTDLEKKNLWYIVTAELANQYRSDKPSLWVVDL